MAETVEELKLASWPVGDVQIAFVSIWQSFRYQRPARRKEQREELALGPNRQSEEFRRAAGITREVPHGRVILTSR